MKTMKFALALTALAALSMASLAQRQERNDRLGGAREEFQISIDEADLHSLKINAGAGSAAAGGGGGAGKVSYSDLSVMKVYDKSSPQLAKKCAQGTHYPSVIISVRKAGREQHEYFKIRMEDVMVTGYQVASNSGDDRPMESISFNYSKIEFKYDLKEGKK
jgi:type VI secretion system secreted protein Hcp